MKKNYSMEKNNRINDIMKYRLNINGIEKFRKDRKAKKLSIERPHIYDSIVISELFYSIYTENT